mmetsp:Transcript_92519/g.261913  ORF Transcript_92519/g.261913 Transcript_92519/m.261913 type:complete len:452 (-) Transcript_92519:96-1451(-)
MAELTDLPAAVRALAEEDSRLCEFAEDYLQGTPLHVLERRMKGMLGASTTLRFVAALRGGSGEERGSAGVPAELEGSLAQRHGSLGDPSWPAPRVAAASADLARPGYGTAAAHEYTDSGDTLRAKVRLLAAMLRQASKTAIYAGAGLSTASGIGDYATKTGAAGVLSREQGAASSGSGRFISPYAVKPNAGHLVVSALARAGLVWRVVQQNHDGCLQKADVPQQLVNEIHGSWFDPGNPVVKMDEAVRGDLWQDVNCVEREADVVVVLGSSLCGMSTDRIVSACARRARNGGSPRGEAGGGTVIVSLQPTPHDGEASLRIFGTITRVLTMLAEELSLDLATPAPAREECRRYVLEDDVFSVPYSASGQLLRGDQASRRALDMREGSELSVTIGSDRGQTAVVVGKHAEGHYKLSVQRSEQFGNVRAVRYLGRWWVEAATLGEIRHLPVVTL